MRLEGRVAIITGAAQGIGLAYAERFLAEGAQVVVAEIDPDGGAAAMERLASDDALYVRTDITEEGSAQGCVEPAVARFGTVDVLVNNAALMARAAAPVMVAKRDGRIINQASIAAYLYDDIAPGVTMTEATRKVVPQKVQDHLVARSAMKQALEPEDLTGVAVFFASDDSRMVTGQVLCVDGGLCMPA